MASLWINEIDYDQAGIDADSFIELTASSTTSLAGYYIVLVNGNGSAPYASYDLSLAGSELQAGQSLLIANSTVSTIFSVPKISTGTTDFIQNGGPDGIALINVNSGQLLEFWSYEGGPITTTFNNVSLPGISSTTPFNFSATSDVIDGLADTNDNLFSMHRTGAYEWALFSPSPGTSNESDYAGGTVGFGKIPARIVEGSSGATTLNLTLTGVNPQNAVDGIAWTIVFPGGAGSATAADFTTLSGVATFAAGDTTATISIGIVGDKVAEASEAFSITLSCDTPGISIASPTVSLTLNNDDGSDAADTLLGSDVRNILKGLGGDDTIRGYGGADLIDGGAGKDLLYGGRGRDNFDFNSISDSSVASADCDRINDFERGKDIIDLRGIDANPLTAADDVCTWRGSEKFSGAPGDVRIVISGDDAYVRLDIDGNRLADMSIFVKGGAGLADTDFLL